MKSILSLLIILLLSSCHNSTNEQNDTIVTEHSRQEYFIGDILDVKEAPIEYQTTKNIAIPTVSIKEGNYVLRVSKADAIEQLRLLASQIDSSEYADIIQAVNVSINYLTSNDDVTFDQMWSTAEAEGMSWSEAAKYDVRLTTKNVLREQIL